MAETVWNVTAIPRGAVSTNAWELPVDATEYFINKGAKITEKFDDNKLTYGPSFVSSLPMKFLNPNGLFSGVSDSRSVFKMSGRENSLFYINDFYTGIGREVGSYSETRQSDVSISTTGISSVLKNIRVPVSALVPGLSAREFIQRCLIAGRHIFPHYISPFVDIRDETDGNNLFSNMIIDDAGTFVNDNCFNAIGRICGVTNTALKVGRTFCGVYNRDAYDKFGEFTVTAEDLLGKSIRIDEGFDRVYTSALVTFGRDGEEIRLVASGGSAAGAFTPRTLNIDLPFITNRFIATEIANSILDQLSSPRREIVFELAGAGKSYIQLLSKMTADIQWILPDAPTSQAYGSPYGTATYANVDRQNVFGDFYVIEVRRDLFRDTIQVRAQIRG